MHRFRDSLSLRSKMNFFTTLVLTSSLRVNPSEFRKTVYNNGATTAARWKNFDYTISLTFLAHSGRRHSLYQSSRGKNHLITEKDRNLASYRNMPKVLKMSSVVSYNSSIWCIDSWRLQKSELVDSLPAPGRQQQLKLLDIIERLLSYGTGGEEYEMTADDSLTAEPEHLLSEWRQMFMDDGADVNKRSWQRVSRSRPMKRGPGMCINSCLSGGMSFVRCKSMCHW